MTTAREFLAAVQQRADAATPQAVRDEPWAAQALAADSTVLVAALTAALDELDEWGGRNSLGLAPRLRAAITAALTPKENDS